MPPTVVNLTSPIVTEKIDDILATYPLYEYRQIFAVPELRQKLTAYVLARLPVVCVTAESTPVQGPESRGGGYARDQQDQINQLIHQGIDALLGGPKVWRHRPSAAPVPAKAVPPNWFS